MAVVTAAMGTMVVDMAVTIAPMWVAPMVMATMVIAVETTALVGAAEDTDQTVAVPVPLLSAD